MEFNVTSKKDLGFLKIYVNEILFCRLNLEKFSGLQSYINNGTFHIEVYTNKQVIHLEFKSIENWKKILNVFDNL